MNTDHQNVQWVVQKNLTSENTYQQIENACSYVGAQCTGVQIIPFTDQLPYFERADLCIPYGSTTFGQLAAKDSDLQKCYFINEKFNMKVYLSRWGKRMLNDGATLVTLQSISDDLFQQQKEIFVRPLDDSKSFSGTVMTFGELLGWRDQLSNGNIGEPLAVSEILISEPYNITREWRLWILNGKVISATRYRMNFRLSKESGCPDEVIRFAEESCLEFTPHDVFVMDIGESAGKLYIIECGCMNSAGFYAGDISEIVKQITAYVNQRS